MRTYIATVHVLVEAPDWTAACDAVHAAMKRASRHPAVRDWSYIRDGNAFTSGLATPFDVTACMAGIDLPKARGMELDLTALAQWGAAHGRPEMDEAA